MKKVLLVSGSLPPIKCGVGYYAERLSRELAAEGLDFNLLSTEGVDENTPAPLLTVHDWRIRSLPKMLAEINKSGAEIIHIQYPAVGYKRQLGINLLPYFLRIRLPKARLIITLHEYSQSGWLGRARNFITIAAAHQIIISNEADRLALPAWLRKRARVIPISSNVEKVPKNPPVFKKIMAKAGLDSRAPILFFFGFPYPNKGLENLLQAMDDERLAGYQLLLLCGLDESNPYQKSLVEHIKKLNRPSKKLAWAGFLSDNEVSAVLQEGKYFVLPQTAPISPKSGTAIAAVRHGLILVTAGADQPAKTKPFEHKLNCYLVGKMSPEALAAAISELDSSPTLQTAIRQGAKELTGYFSWDNVAKQHLELYE